MSSLNEVIPHYLTMHDDIVLYCPILNELFTYSVDFWKVNAIMFKGSGLIYIGEL